MLQKTMCLFCYRVFYLKCFVSHGFLLISCFMQLRKWGTMGLQVGLGVDGLETTLSVKRNEDNLEDG